MFVYVCVEIGAQLNTDASVRDVLQHQPEPEQVNQWLSKDLKNVINKNRKCLSILEQKKKSIVFTNLMIRIYLLARLLIC